MLDTGPLVALLDRGDHYHEWSIAQWSRISPPILTCEAVIVEACFLLRKQSVDQMAVMEMVCRNTLAVDFQLATHADSVTQLLAKYRDIPMTLADACLVRISEIYPTLRVFTLDSDFKIYRRNGRQVIPTLSPH